MEEKLAVVIGQYYDRSALSRVVYGPYAEETAGQIAKELTQGEWMSMGWLAIPIGKLPGEDK